MKKTIFSVIVLAIFITMGALVVKAAYPIGAGGLSGWAWSSNIGWMSASSTQSNAGGGGPYSLTLGAGGNITGYMWSSNIGWIKFGGLSAFPGNPSTDGTTAGDAQIYLATGNATGWIRACAGTVNGNCSTMDSRTDGWDGWISLSGNNYPTGVVDGSRGVTVTSAGNVVGYAWGGPVVGWVNFNGYGGTGLKIDPPTPSDPNFTVSDQPVTVNKNNPTKTVNIQITRVPGNTNAQTVTIVAPPPIDDANNILITSSNLSCTMSTSDTICLIPFTVTLGNTSNPFAATYPVTLTGSNGPKTNHGMLVITVDTTTLPTTSCSQPANSLPCDNTNIISPKNGTPNLRKDAASCQSTAPPPPSNAIDCEYYCDTAHDFILKGTTCGKSGIIQH